MLEWCWKTSPPGCCENRSRTGGKEFSFWVLTRGTSSTLGSGNRHSSQSLLLRWDLIKLIVWPGSGDPESYLSYAAIDLGTDMSSCCSIKDGRRSFNSTVSVTECLCRGDLSPLTWLFWCNFCLRPPCVSHLCRFVSVVCEHDGHLTVFCWMTLNLCQCLCCIRPPDCASGCLNSSFLLRCIRAALQLAVVPLQSEILPHFDGLCFLSVSRFVLLLCLSVK